jgi:ATP-dependent DNA helicase RecG
MTAAQSSLPDWVRLQRALSVEAETGFNNLVGKQQRFSEFLSASLQQPPAILPGDHQQSWQDLAQKYSGYTDLSFAQRQHLVAETRRFLHGTQQLLEQHAATKALRTREGTRPDLGESAPAKTARKALDQPVTYLKGIGPKNSERLAKLGLFTVRDVLFYYPRDHVNYAKQVKIRDLVPGETVTIVGTVSRVNCFTSPRNKKLTIFELQLSDGSGTAQAQPLLPRQSLQQYELAAAAKAPVSQGGVVAASGLVKKGKYGIYPG